MLFPYIKCLKSEKTESSILYGQFLINSLRVGQGITIGNLLRRVLLSDLGGISITAIRIAGIKDEFSIITGVREDILEILLNLKGVIFRSKKHNCKYGRLKIQGPAVITANLIDLPSDLEIVNPNHYIATIATNNFLEIELKIEYGIGYKLASQTFQCNSRDFLQIDAVFMPIQKVDFKIENVYENSSFVTAKKIFLKLSFSRFFTLEMTFLAPNLLAISSRGAATKLSRAFLRWRQEKLSRGGHSLTWQKAFLWF